MRYILAVCLATLGVLFGTGTAQAQTVTPALVLELPPKAIIVPKEFRIAGKTFTFNTSTETFSPASDGGMSVSVEKIGTDASSYYKLTVNGIVKGGGGSAILPQPKTGSLWAKIVNSVSSYAYAPPPASHTFMFRPVYGYKLTLQQPVTSAQLVAFSDFVFANGNGDNDKYYHGNSACQPDEIGQYLCLKTKASFITPERGTTGPAYSLVAMKLPLDGTITVTGDTAAAGQLRDYRLGSPNILAVGGTVNVTGGVQVPGYIQSDTKKFAWGDPNDPSSIAAQVAKTFAKRSQGTTVADSIAISTWNLNARDNNPNTSETSSFSAVPEGKLWYGGNGRSYVLDAVHFKGSGTIIIDGNVTFRGPITCDPTTRVGLIVNGSIDFRNTSIGCGAYFAINGNINFTETVASIKTATGIFAAKENVFIPRVNSGSRLSINYDKMFANNPTVLFQELLDVVFSN